MHRPPGKDASRIAIAALWPPIALTPPPRWAPAPHSRIRGCAVATPHRSAGVDRVASSSANGHASGPWKMLPPGRFSASSRSRVVLVSIVGSPAASTSRRSSIGSARTELSESITAICRRSRMASLFASVTSRSGVCSPKTVRVWAPAVRNSGDRMLGSVSEWQ